MLQRASTAASKPLWSPVVWPGREGVPGERRGEVRAIMEPAVVAGKRSRASDHNPWVKDRQLWSPAVVAGKWS
jgi:hypothetical protein